MPHNAYFVFTCKIVFRYSRERAHHKLHYSSKNAQFLLIVYLPRPHLILHLLRSMSRYACVRREPQLCAEKKRRQMILRSILHSIRAAAHRRRYRHDRGRVSCILAQLSTRPLLCESQYHFFLVQLNGTFGFSGAVVLECRPLKSGF